MTAAPPPPSISAAVAPARPGMVPLMQRAPRVAQRYSAADFRAELARIERQGKLLSLASVVAGLLVVAAVVVLAMF